MRRYAPYAAALAALVFLAWVVLHVWTEDLPNSGGTATNTALSPRPELPIPSARTLLTVDDLRELTGDEYQLREAPTDIPSMTQSAYVGPYRIAITIVVGSSASHRYASFLQYLDQSPELNLGDEAIWVPSRGTLAVVLRDAEIALQVEVREDAQNLALEAESSGRRLSIARSIAEHLLGRLADSSP